MFRILSGVYLGWGLGANDAANVFGTGVAAGVVKYRTAVILTSVFVVAGALLQGSRGMHTIGALTDMDVHNAFAATMAAAITMSVLTVLAIPVSASQAIVGAIVAVGIMGEGIQLPILMRVLISWASSPFAALLISYVLYRVLGPLIENRVENLRSWSVIMKLGFYLVGIYGSFALGANNVANTTGVFLRAGLLTPFMASLLGSVSICLGVCTFSRRVMYTVGKRITDLSDLAALSAVLGQDITVHLFSWVGVPVSTSQAIVGAVIGVGLVKTGKKVNFRAVGHIVLGWFASPAASFVMSYAILKITNA